ncbi:MAG: amidohydrolase family protein [Anaerolineaceae bacterium]|nr:amidohydrolase family protein [Anaerolineaceae bacterium]
MKLTEYRPQSKLITKKSIVLQPRFAVIDAHNHLGEAFGGGWDKKPLSQLLDILDEANISHYVDLDGGFGEDLLNHHLDHFKAKSPERFSIFGGVDWSKWEKYGTGFGEWAADRLKVQARRGAAGLKIWKNFGLHVHDHEGKLVKVDDPRLSPIWDAAGDLNLPVIIHIADPVAFFDPIDEKNERWEELGAHPDWAFPSPPFPSFISILEDFANLVALHPQTTFIGAHMGCYAENLAWVGDLLDRCPDFYVDISARVGELGRQPYTARRFFNSYADRILFGLDMGPDLDAYRIYYRFLETDDEYFNYSTSEIPSQGRWRVYGLFLNDDILKKIYAENAKRVLKME